MIPDLLPHLAGKEQYTREVGEAIEAGKMNLVFRECKNQAMRKKKQSRIMP